MNKDIITLFDENNEKKDYKLLMIIDKTYKYVIYTDLDNMNIKDNLYAVKTKSLTGITEVLPIEDDEWNIIENAYIKLINT